MAARSASQTGMQFVPNGCIVGWYSIFNVETLILQLLHTLLIIVHSILTSTVFLFCSEWTRSHCSSPFCTDRTPHKTCANKHQSNCDLEMSVPLRMKKEKVKWFLQRVNIWFIYFFRSSWNILTTSCNILTFFILTIVTCVSALHWETTMSIKDTLSDHADLVYTHIVCSIII